jgi:hypothetical protein
MDEKLIKTHKYTFESTGFSKDELTLITEFYIDESLGYYTKTKIISQSNYSEIIMNLYGISINADMLFQLAKELKIIEKSMERCGSK